MGKPPPSGPAFRFTTAEVAEMDALLQGPNSTVPTREVVYSLAEKFSASPERARKNIVVQPKQVSNWFQNRRCSQKAKLIKTPGKLNVSSLPRDDSSPVRNLSHSGPMGSGKNHLDSSARVGFEAKSARDGAWYDVVTFVSHRLFETGDPEVRVRFAGFGPDEDEWVNVRKHVRHSSIPCEASECGAILPGDLILCFQERKDQALYLDAYVVEIQRWRHDARGCRCRFRVRYDHDQSQEVVPLRKLCRRPESNYRLQLMYGSKEFASVDLQNMGKDQSSLGGTSRPFSLTQKIRKHRKLKRNVDKVVSVVPSSHSDEKPITVMKTEKFDDNNNNSNSNNLGTLEEPICDAAVVVAALVIGTVNSTDGSVTAKSIEGGAK